MWLYKAARRPFDDILYHKATDPRANSTSRGRFQREAPYVCVHLYEETWTHPSTGTKKKNSAPTLHSFHNVIFVLSQHSQSGL